MGKWEIKCNKCSELFTLSGKFSGKPVCPDCLLKSTRTFKAPQNLSDVKFENSSKNQKLISAEKRQLTRGKSGQRRLTPRMASIHRKQNVRKDSRKKASKADYVPLKKIGRHKSTVRMERIRHRMRQNAKPMEAQLTPENNTTCLDSSKFSAIASTGRYRIEQIKNRQTIGTKYSALAVGTMIFIIALLLDLMLVFFYFPPVIEKTRIAVNMQNRRSKMLLSDLNKISQLPDECIDLARTALLVAREDYELTYHRKLDIEQYLIIVDKMAATIQERIDDNMEPEQVIGEICHYLYDEQKFLTSQNGWDSGNLYLNFILDGKQGYCLGFVELWLALAERILWHGRPLPIYGVLAPFHIFCRWQGKNYRRNIETLHVPPIEQKAKMKALVSEWLLGKSKISRKAGRNIPNSFYREQYNITSESMENGVYLQNISKKAVIGCIYSNRSCLQMDRLESLKTREERTKMLERAKLDVEQANKWSPNNVPGLQAQAAIYIQYRGEYQKAVKLLAKLEKIDPTAKTLILLGMAHSYLGNYRKALKYLSRAEKAKTFRRKTLALIPYLKANVYCLSRQFSQAEDFCNDFLKKNYGKRSSQALMARVFILQIAVKICNYQQKYRKARLYAWRLQNILGTKNEAVANAWGDIFRYEQKWEKARRYYQDVLRWYNSCSPKAWYGMGCYWKHLRNYRRAIDCFQRALMFDVNCIEAKKPLIETQHLLEISRKLNHFATTRRKWTLAIGHF